MVAGLLIDHILHLILGRLQPGTNPSQRLLRERQAGRDDRLTRSNDPVTPALLVFRAIDIKDMVFDVARKAHRIARLVVDDAADFLGILADDGEPRVDLAQTLVTEGVGAGQVGRDIAVGSGEVGQDGLGQAGVAVVGVFEGLGAIGVALEEADGVGDDGVGGEVL